MATQNETWTTIGLGQSRCRCLVPQYRLLLELWLPAESDPGVFTELIQNMGVQGVQVSRPSFVAHDSPLFALIKTPVPQMQELYSLDPQVLSALR